MSFSTAAKTRPSRLHKKPPATTDRRSFAMSGFARSGAVLAPPRKQGGREIRRGAPLALGTGRDRPRVGIRRDHLSIEMPGGVAEQGGDDRKTEEQRQRSQNQQHRDDQSPRRHRYGVLRNRPNRR